MDFILDIVLAIPRWFYKQAADLVASAISGAFGDSVTYDLNAAMAEVYKVSGWLLEMAEFQYGLKVVVSAYIARFLFSMLPFIGR